AIRTHLQEAGPVVWHEALRGRSLEAAVFHVPAFEASPRACAAHWFWRYGHDESATIGREGRAQQMPLEFSSPDVLSVGTVNLGARRVFLRRLSHGIPVQVRDTLCRGFGVLEHVRRIGQLPPQRLCCAVCPREARVATEVDPCDWLGLRQPCDLPAA